MPNGLSILEEEDLGRAEEAIKHLKSALRRDNPGDACREAERAISALDVLYARARREHVARLEAEVA